MSFVIHANEDCIKAMSMFNVAQLKFG